MKGVWCECLECGWQWWMKWKEYELWWCQCAECGSTSVAEREAKLREEV